jgi:hypothetical protein
MGQWGIAALPLPIKSYANFVLIYSSVASVSNALTIRTKSGLKSRKIMHCVGYFQRKITVVICKVKTAVKVRFGFNIKTAVSARFG